MKQRHYAHPPIGPGYIVREFENNELMKGKQSYSDGANTTLGTDCQSARVRSVGLQCFPRTKIRH